MLSRSRDTLPWLAASLDSRRQPLQQRWELPSTTALVGEDWRERPPELVHEPVPLRWRENERWIEICATVCGLPRSPLDVDDEENGSDPQTLPLVMRAARDVELMVHRHVFVMHEALGLKPPPDAFSLDYSTSVGVVRDFDEVLRGWSQVGGEREPRYALIVKLAERLRTLLSSVCEHPRVVLRRTRELLSVGCVQQLDASCLRWLARQPGLSVIEKAGSRQQVLGIARIEQADTLENRVVKDLCRRGIRAGMVYLREYQGFSGHARVIRVREFVRLLRRLLRYSPISQVSDLWGIPQPNYVLQHDPRYSKIWADYLRLIRQEREIDDAWRWRNRIWAEEVLLAVAAAIRLKSQVGRSLRGDCRLHAEQMTGRFVDPSTMVPPLLFSDEALEIVQGPSQISEHPHIPPVVVSAGPDFVMVLQKAARAPKCVPVWVWPLLPIGQVDELSLQVNELISQMQPADARPLVIIPDLSGDAGHDAGHPNVFALSPKDPQSQIEALKRVLISLLKQSPSGAQS